MDNNSAEFSSYTCAITDALEVPVSLVAPDYRFLYANPAYHRYYRTDSADLTGRHAGEIIGEPLFSRKVKPQLDKCLRKRESVEYDQELDTPEGGIRYLRISYTPFEREGKLIGAIVAYRDRTEEYYQSRRLADINASLPGFIYQFRIDGRGKRSIPYVSAGCRRLYGVEPEALISESALFTERIHPEDRDAMERAIAASAADLSCFEVELRIIAADGQVHWIHAQAVPYRQEDGGIVWSGVAVDINRLRRAEETKQRFLTNMSHELRTPLNGILGMLSLLSGGPHPEEQRPYLDMAAESAQHLLSIVQQMLDFSRIRSRSLTLNSVEFDIVREMERLVDRYRRPAEEKGLTLELAAGQQNCRIRGDRVRISQIMINLLSNAIKYSERGTIRVELDADERLTLRVGDQGIGIPVDRQAELFEPFHQLEDPYTKEHGGTGIGLAIVKSLTTLMGGEVELRSAPGEGTTVTVELPLSDGECASVDEKRPVSTIDSGSAPGLRRVLIVEDEAVNRFFLRKLLTARDYIVREAGDGLEAIEAIRAERPDLVLMDIGLPRMNGIDAIRELRGREGFTDLPILAVTAHTHSEDRERIMDAGADDIVIKPYRDDEIFEKIARFSGEAEK